jgi:putative flavoprotein involved in K+ transport
MRKQIETVIIGGGQAGLATSYHLTNLGHENIVVEKAEQAGNAWRNARWDSFTLNTPNWSFRLPGAEYQGTQPDGFMPRGDIVASFEGYIDRFHLPIKYGVQIQSVEQQTESHTYLVKSTETSWEARNVVVATGIFQQPKIPTFSADMDAGIFKIPAGKYRNPDALPLGAVLIVGSGQSGCQIAEELYQSGRKVYLCVGSAGRVPRRYRGRDIFEWYDLSGYLDRTVDRLTSPQAKFGANPHVSGKDGGHNLNLHQFTRDGVLLLGHIRAAQENLIWFAQDLKENLAKVDKFEAKMVEMIDQHITQTGIHAPEEILPDLRDGYQTQEVAELNLQSAGITSIIWAMGHRFDFSMIKIPVFDSDGFPIQKRGVTSYPGLYFVGLPWLYKPKSGLLLGVGEDAEFLAFEITGNKL